MQGSLSWGFFIFYQAVSFSSDPQSTRIQHCKLASIIAPTPLCRQQRLPTDEHSKDIGFLPNLSSA